jgi:hypothetical protein
MAITSLPFILNQFENEKYRYFIVRDEDGDIVLAQNDVIDAGAALQKLRSFFGNNFGSFTIEIFPAKLTSIRNMAEHDKKRQAKYKVEITQEVLPNGVGGLTGMGSAMMGGYGSLAPDDPRSNAPNMFQVLGQLANVEQQMRLMEKDHDHYRQMKELQDKIARMEEEQSKARGMGAIVDRLGEQFSDPQVLLGLISGVSQLFNRQPQHVTPMNGIPETVSAIDQQIHHNIIQGEMQNETHQRAATQKNDRQSKVVEAVNQLIQHDPAFPENIAKLAELAKRNPGIYKMAVQYLKGL